jgi:hypothetical protein
MPHLIVLHDMNPVVLKNLVNDENNKEQFPLHHDHHKQQRMKFYYQNQV